MRITWRLWNLLRYPPRLHPVFWRVVNQPGLRLPPNAMRGLRWLAYAGLAALLVASPVALVLVVYWIVLLPVVLLIFSGSLYGVYRAMDISVTLSREHQQGTYDLLRVTPPGAAGIDWMIGAACLHRGNTLGQLHRTIRAIVLSCMLALVVVNIFILLSFGVARDEYRLAVSQQALNIVSTLIALCVICYCDHVQSIVTGCLVGIITAGVVKSTTEGRVWAVPLFLAIQFGSYLLIFVMVTLAQVIISALANESPGGILASAASAAFIYYLVREAVIGMLWRYLLHQSQTSVGEWQTVWQG
jgi:hypothetical protein